MPTNPATWRDMYRDNPDYFDTAPLPAGYPERAPVPDRLRRGAGLAAGDTGSHQLACTYVLRHAKEPGIRLVHGSIDPGETGDRQAQAWVELDGNLTFDGHTREFFATDRYQAALHAEPDRRYTAAEAARLLLNTGHPGPWTATELAATDD
jgi:hypothetical protein